MWLKVIEQCDRLLQGKAISKRLTKKYDVMHTGVTTDNYTPSGAVIMVGTVLLYAIVQVCTSLICMMSNKCSHSHLSALAMT